MALRLQGGGYSYDGTAWDVYLYGPGSGSISAHLGEDIVSIRYDGNDLDINSPIIPSSASITIKAKNQTEIDANQALLSEIALAGEGEFILKVYRNSTLNWVGLVLSDQIKFDDDRLPRPITIRAVDGLARLKEIEFNKDGEEFPPSLAYLSQHLIIALQKTGLWAELSPGLRVSTGWTNAEVSGYNSFLEGIRLNHIVWLSIDKKGGTTTTTNKRSKTAWQVLEEFAKLFHARILMANGSYWLIQIPQYLTAATATIHTFDDNGAVSGTTSGLPIAYSNEYTQVIGASWEYQPATKRVKVTYRHSSAENINIQINFLTGPVSISAVESFSGTAKIYLSFLLAYPTQLPSSYPTYLSHVHKFKVTIKVGNYWLKQTAQIILGQIIYSTPTWVTTGADYEFFVYPSFGPNGQNRYNFNLVSPPLPANGDATISLSYVFTYFLGSGTNPAITPFEWSATNANFQVLPVGLVEEAFNETEYTQESNLTATKQLEIVSSFGDGPYSYTLTTMKARRPEGTTPPITQSWTGSGATGTIHQVLANSIIKFSGKVAKKINLPFIGSDYAPHGLVQYESAFYILLSGDFTARPNTWSGVFIQVADRGNGVALPSKKFILAKPSPRDIINGPVPIPYFPTIPDDGRWDLPEVKKADLTALRAGIIPTTTDEPIEVGTVNSIPINPFDLDRVLLAGDKIIITDVYTGKPTIFTVATNTTAGASSISVVSQSVTDRIVDGSYIQLEPEYLYTRGLSTLSNIGTGAQVYKSTASGVASIRSILAGSGITVSQNANDITISAIGGGSMSSFQISGDSGTINAITDGETLLFVGGTGVTTQVSTNQITINLNIAELTTIGLATNDFFAFYDSSGFTHAKATIQDIINLIPAGFTSFNISADSGTQNAITNGEIFFISGGGGLRTTVSTNQVTVFLDFQNGLGLVTPATNDSIPIYDVSTSSHARITIQSILDLVPSGFTGFTISANAGTPNGITNGETFTINGGTAIDTTVGANQVTANFNLMKLGSTASPTSDDFIVLYDNALGQHVRSTIANVLALSASSFSSFNIGGDTGSANSITNGETLTVSGGTAISTVAVTNGVLVSLNIAELGTVSNMDVFDRFPIYDNSTGGQATVSGAQIRRFIGVFPAIVTATTNSSGLISFSHSQSLNSPGFATVHATLTNSNPNAATIKLASLNSTTIVFEIRDYSGALLASEGVTIHLTINEPLT